MKEKMAKIFKGITAFGEKTKELVVTTKGVIDKATKMIAEKKDQANSLEIEKYNEPIRKQLTEKIRIHYKGMDPRIDDVHNTLKENTTEGYNVSAEVHNLCTDYGVQEAYLKARVDFLEHNEEMLYSGMLSHDKMQITKIYLDIKPSATAEWFENQIQMTLPKKFPLGELVGHPMPLNHADGGAFCDRQIIDYEKNGKKSKKVVRYVRFLFSSPSSPEKKQIDNYLWVKETRYNLSAITSELIIPFPDEKQIRKEIKKDKKNLLDKIWEKDGHRGNVAHALRLHLGEIKIMPKDDSKITSISKDKIIFAVECQAGFRRLFNEPKNVSIIGDFHYEITSSTKLDKSDPDGVKAGSLRLLKHDDFVINY
jgi:hypothetical protein